ncbi:MAG TPA: DUF2891 domain-containing protein [Edaphocola sp.]|nr:DUF2891 domain-containing protein [Edaphocola sp.]
MAQLQITPELALSLSRMPLHCIGTEFPNKTSHLADGKEDAKLLPSELHPVFYGCLDWHSSVHGHWMLVKLLQTFPNISNKDSIIALLDNSFQIEKMKKEAEYFGKYTASKNYERTYGWAWLLKLDQALGNSQQLTFKKWHAALQPLTQKIVALWKDYLPKLTYPNRTGVHPNTAFGLDFAYDWAVFYKDEAFAKAIKDKALEFYGNNQNIPAYLEPDGSDFFSPSLMAASLMSKMMDNKTFNNWLKNYYSKESIDRICTLPMVSDRSDYQIVHLDGLSFSRAWCMRTISKHLSNSNPLKERFNQSANQFLTHTLPAINDNYGGGHWLASFAIYALLES